MQKFQLKLCEQNFPESLIQQIAAIHTSSFEKGWGERDVEQLLAVGSNWVFWAEDNNKIIGFCLVRKHVDEVEIITIAVDKDYRKMGVAKAIFGSFFDYAMAEKIKKIFLEVAVEDEAAISLYKKLGFKELSVRKNYYQRGGRLVDAINMVLDF